MDTELICEVLHLCVIMKGTVCSLNCVNAILGNVSISCILSLRRKKKNDFSVYGSALRHEAPLWFLLEQKIVQVYSVLEGCLFFCFVYIALEYNG